MRSPLAEGQALAMAFLCLPSADTVVLGLISDRAGRFRTVRGFPRT